MLKFLLSRFLQSVVTLFLIITGSFIIIKAAPGDPLANDRRIPEHVREKLAEKYWLDKPVFVQYLRVFQLYGSGDLGISMKSDAEVLDIIEPKVPISMAIGALGLITALAIGIPIGVIAAMKKNTMFDYAPMSLAMVGICLPTFVLGPLFALFFALGVEMDDGTLIGFQWLEPVWAEGDPLRWIFPSVTLGIFYAAYIARLTRGGMLEVLSQDFVRTAIAKGVPKFRMIVRHTLRGGLMPVVSFLGPAAAGLVSGSFVVETVFAVPGLGKHFVEAAFARDLYLILGTVVVYGVLLITFNLVVDILQVLINPKLKLGGA